MCQQGVVREFNRCMKKHQILYCDPYIKRNEGLSVAIPRLNFEGQFSLHNLVSKLGFLLLFGFACCDMYTLA